MNALQRDLKKLVPLVESLGKETVAADPHRQRFHLQPPVGWLNDPNGLCVYGGQYHAFFQYGPFDVNGGVKHWGHAVSTDLLHWEQLPVMLYPDEPFDCHGAYSGSALWRMAPCTSTTPATSSTPAISITSKRAAGTTSAWPSARTA